MPLQLFLNELSVPGEKLARAVAVAHLRELVATIRSARDIHAGAVLNSDVSLADFPLGDGATVASIRNDGECVEESLYLKTIATRAPLNLVAVETGSDDPDLREYKLLQDAPIHPGVTATGLGFTHLLRGLGLSLPSHELWLERLIELDLATLDATGNIVASRVIARNADRPNAVAFHTDALQELFAPLVANGGELWERRTELLPNLKFIPRTKAQIESILSGDPMLAQAWIKLRGIDQAIEAWKIAKGPYPLFPFNVRPESRTRRGLATFNDADGNERTFSDHCDLAPTEGRIHFIVEGPPQPHALIGHVGRKLGIG